VLLLFRRDDISGMKAQDWGNFVAGFAAPLAFFWLVVAVYIQRNELRAQIKELRASRDALEAQVQETRNSVAQFSEQTNVSRIQLDRFLIESVNRDVEARLFGWANSYYNLSKGLPYIYSNVTFLGQNLTVFPYKTCFDVLPASDDIKNALSSGNLSVAIREIELELKGTNSIVKESTNLGLDISLKEIHLAAIHSVLDDLQVIFKEYPKEKNTFHLKINYESLIETIKCYLFDVSFYHDQPRAAFSGKLPDEQYIKYLRLYKTNLHLYLSNGNSIGLPREKYPDLYKIEDLQNIFCLLSPNKDVLFIDDNQFSLSLNDLKKFDPEYIKRVSSSNR
jgi:hypothetical protein